MSSFWRNFHHWLHWKLSFWQLSVQPVMKISSKWRHFRFSEWRKLTWHSTRIPVDDAPQLQTSIFFVSTILLALFNSISRKASLYNTIQHWSGVIFTPACDDYTWTEEITHIVPGKSSTTWSNRIYLTNDGLTNVFCWSVPSKQILSDLILFRQL